MDPPGAETTLPPLAKACFLCAKSDFTLFDAAGSERLIFKAFFMKLSLDNFANKICSTCWYHVKLLAEFRQSKCEGNCTNNCFWSSVMNGSDSETNTRQSIYMEEVEKRYFRYVYSVYAAAKKVENRERIVEMMRHHVAMRPNTMPTDLIERDPKLLKCRVRLIIDRAQINQTKLRKRKRSKKHIKQSEMKALLKSQLEVVAGYGERTSAREASRFKVPDVIFTHDIGHSPRGILHTPDRQCDIHGSAGAPTGSSNNSNKRVQWSKEKVIIKHCSYKNEGGDSDDEVESIVGEHIVLAVDSNSTDDNSDSDHAPKKRKKFNTSPLTVSHKEIAKNKKKTMTNSNINNTAESPKASPTKSPPAKGAPSKSSGTKAEKKEVLLFKLDVPLPTKRKLKLTARRLESDYLRNKFGRKIFSANVQLTTLRPDTIQASQGSFDQAAVVPVTVTKLLPTDLCEVIASPADADDEVETILCDDPQPATRPIDSDDNKATNNDTAAPQMVDEFDGDEDFPANNSNIASLVESLSWNSPAKEKPKSFDNAFESNDSVSTSMDSLVLSNSEDRSNINTNGKKDIINENADYSDSNSTSLDRVATPPPPTNGIKTKAASKEMPPLLSPLNGIGSNLDTDDIFNLIMSSPSTHNGQVKLTTDTAVLAAAKVNVTSMDDLLPTLNSDNSDSASITAGECHLIDENMLGLPLDFLENL